MQVEKRLHEIREMLIDVPLECIINIDESALQHRTTSSRSFCTVNTDGRGVKRSKERITVTLGVSASGEKFCTQVIAKSARPRALKNIPDISKAFGIIYDHQAKAWQDTSSYMRLLHTYNKIAKQRNSIFYILQDNCSSHVCAAKIFDPTGSQETLFKYQNLCIIFFPPNATSNCQPLDQGVIRSFKARFRRAQLNHLLSEYEIWQTSERAPASQFPINVHTHLRNVLGWVKSASDGIEENTIRRCFVKANCLPVVTNVIANEHIDLSVPNSNQAVDDLVIMLREIRLEESFSVSLGLDDENFEQVAEELIEMDALDATGDDEVDDANIVQSVLEQHNLMQNSRNIDDDDVEEIPPLVSVEQANRAITDFINFLSLESSLSSELQSNLLSNLQKARRPLIHQQKVEKNRLLKQSALSMYFTSVQKEMERTVGI
jgi:hypothetical protein